MPPTPIRERDRGEMGEGGRRSAGKNSLLCRRRKKKRRESALSFSAQDGPRLQIPFTLSALSRRTPAWLPHAGDVLCPPPPLVLGSRPEVGFVPLLP